jgi:hypothetical protein
MQQRFDFSFIQITFFKDKSLPNFLKPFTIERIEYFAARSRLVGFSLPQDSFKEKAYK